MTSPKCRLWLGHNKLLQFSLLLASILGFVNASKNVINIWGFSDHERQLYALRCLRGGGQDHLAGTSYPSSSSSSLAPAESVTSTISNTNIKTNTTITRAQKSNQHLLWWRRSYKLLWMSIRKTLAFLIAASGFLSSNLINIFMSSRQQERREISKTLRSVELFLKQSGVESEFRKRLNLRLLDNLVILSRIQRQCLGGCQSRRNDASHGFSIVSSSTTTTEDAYRYMKYATAAYGSDMIHAASIQQSGIQKIHHIKKKSLFSSSTRQPTKKNKNLDDISHHIGIPTHDIISSNVTYGGSMNYLRHFVAMDHERREVIVSIRGTFSVSELITDIAGYSRVFCGGEAHSAIATMAESIWTQIEPTLHNIFQSQGSSRSDYKLILTGHSLGAGAACLLTIYIHYYNLLPRKQLGNMCCMAFASPPVFATSNNNNNKNNRAIQCITNYILENDIVPFLSLDSVRRTLACVGVIDSFLQQEFSGQRRQRNNFIRGKVAPTDNLIQLIQTTMKEDPKPKIEGAPMLQIPASQTIWCCRLQQQDDEDNEDEYYNVKVCDSFRLAQMGILLHPDLLLDHQPQNYEYALGRIVSSSTK